jgi:hypothetical protein
MAQHDCLTGYGALTCDHGGIILDSKFHLSIGSISIAEMDVDASFPFW